MESRFRFDFRHVRVHDDATAAAMAASVGARAYTFGSRIVLGAGELAPGSRTGFKLLAHELAHVVQQSHSTVLPSRVAAPSDRTEREAEAASEQVARGAQARVEPVSAGAPVLARTVGRLHCPPHAHGAPAHPRTALTPIDARARQMAQQLAAALATDATTVHGGIPAAPSASLQAYIDHFDLPPPAGGGFLNRLTGKVRPTREIATSEELRILSRRFHFIARFFTGRVPYRCTNTDCDDADAFVNDGDSTIFLCPTFWAPPGFDATGDAIGFDDDGRAAVLVHEALHVSFSRIGDDTLRGAGGRFRQDGCYEAMVDDFFGTDSHATCP